MRLRIVILPFLIFALFGYGVLKLDKATEGATQVGSFEAVGAAVKADAVKVKTLAAEQLAKLNK